jgi:CRISPR-associated protein Csb2
MLRAQVRFPLGVYNAVSVTTPPDPEWPPSPLRLIGALLAAAHGRPGRNPDPDRRLIQLLCEAPPPLVQAPWAARIGDVAGPDDVFMLRGATRWVSRNYVKSNEGLSTRNLGRERSEVSKAGVAVGEAQLAFLWPDLELAKDQLAELQQLAADVAFLGTARSPAIVTVDAEETAVDADVWAPLDESAAPRAAVPVRVPHAATLSAFDRREGLRASKSKLEGAGMVPTIATGHTILYRPPRGAATAEVDPRWWGEVIVLAVDDERSELIPKVGASYLFARGVRMALLGAYGEEGTPNEAPPALRARGSDPHCAIVPLPMATGPRPDWRIRGVAFILPSPDRAAQIHDERQRIVRGLARLAGPSGDGSRRFVQIPGAGRVWLREPDARRAAQRTLRTDLYMGPARAWRTLTPVVHSRWRKESQGGLLGQVEADCRHVNLPAPESVRTVRGGHRMIPPEQLPEEWRGLLGGPSSHLELTFPQPVRGPILLGRARHFGLGLCIPNEGRAHRADHTATEGNHDGRGADSV